MDSNLVLVHGLFRAKGTKYNDDISTLCALRAAAFRAHGDAVGVRRYDSFHGGGKLLANRLLRLARGTALPVDAVELVEIDVQALHAALVEEPGRARWQTMASCEQHGFDCSRSFVLMGKQRQLVRGPSAGQRVFWFGHGVDQLSEAEFIAHYTGHHGPLVADNARVLGIRRYRQVANEETALCDGLREVGLGQAVPNPVFAELVMGSPPLDLSSLRVRRRATRSIKADEKRHIDFRRSMLLLA